MDVLVEERYWSQPAYAHRRDIVMTSDPDNPSSEDETDSPDHSCGSDKENSAPFADGSNNRETLDHLPSLPPEPTYEFVECVEIVEIIPVVEPVTTTCWYCGDPAVLNEDRFCQSCQERKERRAREQEMQRRCEPVVYDEGEYSAGEANGDLSEVDWYSRESRSTRSRAHEDYLWTGPLQGAMILYALLMLTSLIWGASLLSRMKELTQDDLLNGTAVVEWIDTVIALLGLVLIGRKPLPRPSRGTRPLAWGLAIPSLAILITLNLLYTEFLRDALQARETTSLLPFTLVTVVLVCVQPAIVEELVFRYIAFGAMYRAAGLHATVWITGVMFAVMHIYNPLGVPYLILVGVVLGYARVWGGLALPMVMHFIHNFVVIALEAAK
ncbi:MAG TPA: type II CAAX endopeptidase family protein [Gemmata sp.]|nr:type II CAAX endopeptidase family protein [Gemmata sp.]